MNERSAYQATNQRGRLTTSIIRNEYSIKPISPPITPPPFHKKSIDNHHHHLSSPYSISSSIIQDKGFQTSAVRNARPAYSNAPFPLRITIPVTPPLKTPPMRGLMAPPPLVFTHHQAHPSQPPQHLLQPPYPLQPVLESSLPATMIPLESHLSFTFGQMPPLPQSAMLRVIQPIAVPVTTMHPRPQMVPSSAPMPGIHSPASPPLVKVDAAPLLSSLAPLKAHRTAFNEAEEQKGTNIGPIPKVTLNTKVVQNNPPVLHQGTHFPDCKSVKPKRKSRKAFANKKIGNNSGAEKQPTGNLPQPQKGRSEVNKIL